MRSLVMWIVAGSIAWASPAAARQVVISEIMPSNTSTLTDEDGDTPDWIELVNEGAVPVDLGGYGLTDDPADPYRWTVPGITLDPGEFLLILASGKDRPGPVGEWRTVVARGTNWRYLAGSSTPGPAWTGLSYNDSPWAVGPSGFGYGDGDDATVLGTQTNTVYVRTEFQVDDVSKLVGAVFHVDFDDGFVAYLNGVEIARANMGAPGTPTSVGQFASDNHEALMYRGIGPLGYRLTDLGHLFVTGRNVLAVEGHNVSSTSSDLSLIPFLSFGVEAPEVSFDGIDPELDGLIDVSPHTSFRVSEGETVCLTPADGSTSDCLEIPPIPADVSMGRDPVNGSIGFFETATPGWANSAIEYAGEAPPPTFSQDAGFFDVPFTLTVSSDVPGARIAYTTDGSDPPETATLLGVTMNVNATTVVRARVTVPGMLPGPIVTRTYFFDDRRDLPVISISTTPSRLWDWETGIYVEGPNAESADPHFGANYWQDWEIPVHFEWFEPGGDPGYEADVGMSIYGAWSRARPQKSVALYARGQYGTDALRYPFFEDRPFESYQNLVLRNSGNDWNRSVLRDGYMQSLIHGTAIDWMAYRPAVVYLNGEYWGIQNVREKINEHYVANVGDVDPDEIDMLEFAGGPSAIQGDTGQYDELIRYLEQTDMTSIEALEEAGRRMDLDNWVDYQIAEIFFNNRDWPGNNTKFWRRRTSDARWRWILFDTDFGFGLYGATEYTLNTLAFASESNGPDWPNPPYSTVILRRLLTNGRFRRVFVNRFADFLNYYFDVDRMEHVLDSLAAAIEPEIPRHGNRWGMNLSSWRDDLSRMRTFARNRPGYMLDHVRSLFGLAGRSSVSVEVAAPGGGRIRVNRLEVGSAPWGGTYFAGIPVPITAVPDPGYRFAGWTGSAETSDRVIEVDPSGGVTLVAHFAEDNLEPSGVVINEIQYHAADATPSEDWIELYNTNGGSLDVGGWSVDDGGAGNVYVLPDGTTISAGGYLVLCQDPAAFASVYGSVTCGGGWTFGLSAGGEAVYLRDAGGVLVDSVAFGDSDPWPPDADGIGSTLELVDPAKDNALPESWNASVPVGGTPGARNSTATAREAAPELPVDSPRISVFPNPFVGRVAFDLAAPSGGEAVVEVYDALGRGIDRLSVGPLSPGPNEIVWIPPSDGAGLRFIRLVVDGVPVATTTAVRLH